MFVAALVGYSAWYLTPSLDRAWFFRSDEYVIVGEIIRFLHFDFRQHYFDMPGTPLMFFSAIAWAFIYAVERIAGATPHGTGLYDFTFGHLPLLFGMVRAVSLICGLVSIVLVFALASRLMNRAGACVAALVFAMCPVYGWTESFIRVEPPMVCLMVLSIFALQRALRPNTAASLEGRWIWLAGWLAGFAAAFRLHSITASIPLLLLMLLWSDAPAPPYPEWLKIFWRRLLWAGLAAAVAGMIGIKTQILPHSSIGRELTGWWPEAFESLFGLLLIAAIAVAAIFAMELTPWTRRFAGRILEPRVFLLACGAVVGVVMGTPTILWRAQSFFLSVGMYTTGYLDVDRMGWPVLKHMAWLFDFYMRAVASDFISLSLIAAGAALIILRRDRRLLPFLASCVLFFLVRPMNIRPYAHQMIAWLPFFAILAGYAAAQGYQALGRAPHSNIWQPAALATLIGAMLVWMVPGPKSTMAGVNKEERRMRNIALATDWIHANAEPDSSVAISFFCFNSDVFYSWLRALDVAGPASTGDRRQYIIWWGDHAALKGRRGYVCATQPDVDNIKRKLDLQSPGQGTDPYHDAGFMRAKQFGAGANEVDVFRFDFGDGTRVRPPVRND